MRAGVVGYLIETAHKAITPMWQPGAYICSCELRSVVEGAHSNLARKTKGWLEHEMRHAAIVLHPAGREAERSELSRALCSSLSEL
jgi:hypothetical protein